MDGRAWAGRMGAAGESEEFSGRGYSCAVISPQPGSGLDGALREAERLGAAVRVFDCSSPFHLLDGISPGRAARLIAREAMGASAHRFWTALLERHVGAALGLCLLRADAAGDRGHYGLSALLAMLSDPGEAGRAAAEIASAPRREGDSPLPMAAAVLPLVEGVADFWGMAGPVRDGVRGFAEAFLDRFGGHPLAMGEPVKADAVLPAEGASVFVNGYVSSCPGIGSLAGSFLRLKIGSQHRLRVLSPGPVIPLL